MMRENITIRAEGHPHNFRLIGWMLAAYVVSLPIQFPTNFGFRLAPSDLCLLAALLFGAGKIKLRFQAWSFWHFGVIVVFALGTYMAVIHNGSLSRYELVQKDFGLITLFLGYAVLTTFVNSWLRLRALMKIFLISVVVQNVFALAIYASGLDITWMNPFYPRLSGMLIDPNAYGGLLVVAFAFHIVTYYQKLPLIPSFWGLVTTVTLASGIWLTFSRSAWIGMVLVLSVVLILRPAYAWRMLLVFATAVALILLYFGKGFLDVFVNMASRPSQIYSRLEILHRSVEMFAENPLFGTGLGMFARQEGVIIHNTPVWFLTEFGLFGGVIFVGFVSWFIMKGMSVYQRVGDEIKPLVMALLLAHVAMLGLSLGIEAFYQRHWWFVLALIASHVTLLGERERHTERWSEKWKRMGVNATFQPFHHDRTLALSENREFWKESSVSTKYNEHFFGKKRSLYEECDDCVIASFALMRRKSGTKKSSRWTTGMCTILWITAACIKCSVTGTRTFLCTKKMRASGRSSTLF